MRVEREALESASLRTACEQAHSGVRCRVILDTLGSYLVDDELVDRMSESGATAAEASTKPLRREL